MIEIRPAKIADAKPLIQLKSRLLRETRFLLLEPSEYPGELNVEISFIERYQASENSLFLLALEEGKLLGHIGVQGGSFQRTRHSATLFMAVLEACWGRGIGHRLLESALSWFQSSPLTRQELTTATDNARALSLYQRAGFQLEGIKRQDIMLDDRAVDSYLMSYLKHPHEDKP